MENSDAEIETIEDNVMKHGQRQRGAVQSGTRSSTIASSDQESEAIRAAFSKGPLGRPLSPDRVRAPAIRPRRTSPTMKPTPVGNVNEVDNDVERERQRHVRAGE